METAKAATDRERRLAFWVCILSSTLALVLIRDVVLPRIRDRAWFALADWSLRLLAGTAPRFLLGRVVGAGPWLRPFLMAFGPALLVSVAFGWCGRDGCNAGLLRSCAAVSHC
ncbi:hypothetical protein CDD83_1271 [Cordyceps sp. RAO-2017]|nr:hypothetical protein CDD83_1271 [Cordyceps sp. RAO-2017]